MSKKGISRRDFLKLSAAGVGSLLLPKTIAGAMTAGDPAPGPYPVRELGRTGIRLPVLSMGVMRADNPNLVRAAYNSDIVMFDTAHGYQNGKNEEMLGRFFEGKPRESFCLATKVKSRYPFGENFEQEFMEKADLSLQRLKMEYVDIFYAHDLKTVEEVRSERLIAALQKLKSEGKARFIGFSTHAHKPELLDAAVQAGVYDVILLSYNFQLKNLDETREAVRRAAEAGIGLVAMKTMTGGVEDADGKKKINAQACLRWVWDNPHITTAIPGFSGYDELEECISAAREPEITPEDRQYLAELRSRETLLCQQCGACVEQCPKKLPIPDLMRAYMYAYGYKYSSLSKETLEELGPLAGCSDCAECRVACPSGFRVSDKIAAILPVAGMPYEFLT